MTPAALLLGNVKTVIAVSATVAVMNLILRFILSPSISSLPLRDCNGFRTVTQNLKAQERAKKRGVKSLLVLSELKVSEGEIYVNGNHGKIRLIFVIIGMKIEYQSSAQSRQYQNA
jgi:hypothetical protein